MSPPAPSPLPTAAPRSEPSKPKTTFNLNQLFKAEPEAPREKAAPEVAPAAINKPLTLSEVKKVWSDFAELRKNQIAEYNLLTRDFELEGNQVILPLTNPIEEPLLQGIRTSLITYLRDKLSHSSINVTGILQQVEGKKMIYTNKDKFDHLIERNPALRQLQEKFGLDPDF